MVNQPGFKKYLSSTSWLFAEKVSHIVISLFITIWMARYLGPEQFGIFNYSAFFVVALFGVCHYLDYTSLRQEKNR